MPTGYDYSIRPDGSLFHIMQTPTASASGPLRLLYGLYAWLVLLLVVIVVAAGLLLPGLQRRRAVARWGAATVARLVGSPVEVRGRVPTGEDVAVVVANHQSYLDGIILTAVLPPHYTFLIKGEMVRVPIASFVLRRLGSEFVDRTSSGQRHRSARRLVQAARAGRALAVFPEGTFDKLPGLKPFHLGAFRAAFLLCPVGGAEVQISLQTTVAPGESGRPEKQEDGQYTAHGGNYTLFGGFRKSSTPPARPRRSAPGP